MRSKERNIRNRGNERMQKGLLSGLIVTYGATMLAAVIGSAASITAPEVYRRLEQPAWAPPASVFGPVWTLLYVMMATAAWMIYRSDAPKRRLLIGIFLGQLCLNALWSWTFFKWGSGVGSVSTIVALWFAILVTLIGFWRVKVFAGALMLPYLAWVTFASFLNWTLWQLNQSVL
jgi:translocator protein